MSSCHKLPTAPTRQLSYPFLLKTNDRATWSICTSLHFFFLCPCFSVAMHVSCPCDCAQHSSLSEPTCCRIQTLQTKPIAMEKEDLLYFSLFTLCPVPALPGLLHESLSCVKAWSSRSFRSCLHVPFFINLRTILAPALEQAHLPLGIHLLFHEQLFLISSFRNTYI